MSKHPLLHRLLVIAIMLLAVAVYASAFLFAVDAFGHLTVILWTEEMPIADWTPERERELVKRCSNDSGYNTIVESPVTGTVWFYCHGRELGTKKHGA